MGDADYMLAFQHIVMPVAYEFDPDFVISESRKQSYRKISNKVQSPLDSMLLRAINLVAALSHLRVMLK